MTQTTVNGQHTRKPDHEVIIIGVGMCGIYQLYRLVELGVDVTALEGSAGIGGTWYWNRYPGCRFDSESYTYGFSFSKELLSEWHWKERFSPQPENLKYVNYVADKFNLHKHIQLNARVKAAHFDETHNLWQLSLEDGRQMTCRFLLTALGLLSTPTMPRIAGAADFKGQSFHTFYWPHEPVELTGKKVAVIGTGATGVQVISEIADKVKELTVFQRRPNWCAPLNNSPISAEEMDQIRAKYEQIFTKCSQTPGGFEHEPDRRGFYEVSREERLALWKRLYGEPGFGIWLSNFREIFTDEKANAEFSEFIADNIRSRVKDPVVAEKLIPKDHGFGIQRVPLETRYYEAYNRENVHLVDLQETPIECITPTGIRTTKQEYDFDIIVYATGFDAMTGAFDRIDIRGVGGQQLRDKWVEGPTTFLGLQISGFPNMVMLAGPQSGSSATNFPRGIEVCVDWATKLLQFMWQHGYTRMEATPEAEERWSKHVAAMYNMVLMRKAKSWFTGYNSNVDGHEFGKIRHLVYNGGAPKYFSTITEVAGRDYEGLVLS
ncbi:MAG: NAD(P)/FAD-dependent oxidoreductase [Deltaproteobacteria bacterium]|nr:NAD(P)/FAD-dependent oxidoreductase [Deltaproteobacteria bacterium]